MTISNMTNPQLALYLAINDKYYVTQRPELTLARAEIYLEWLNKKDAING